MSDQSHSKDIRWKQRFQNYRLALARLTEAVDLSRQRALTDLEKQGLVQAFEFTHEMAWNVLKDYLEAQGFTDIVGSRGATRQAFKDALIADTKSMMILRRSVFGPGFFFRLRFRAFAIDYAALFGST